MKKEDLKYGNVIETRNGNKYIYNCQEKELLNLTGEGWEDLTNFSFDMKHDFLKEFDIIKVYEDYTLKKVLWERKEKTKLTETEKVILSNLPKECKYIARDREGNLYVHLLSPRKEWGQWLSKGSIESLVVYNHLFNFIKWEDELPTLIEDLLKE